MEKMMMPAYYNVLSTEEMTYTEGGANATMSEALLCWLIPPYGWFKGEINQDLYQVVLTIDGSEDTYAKDVVNQYNSVSNIHFTGLLSLDDVFAYYKKSSCLIFPSKLETWGLPISEAKEFDLPMIVADLPYAHETVGTYDGVCFFDVNDADDLKVKMKKAILKEDVFSLATYKNTSPNVCKSWNEVITKL